MSSDKRDLKINPARHAIGDVVAPRGDAVTPRGKVTVVHAGFQPRIEKIEQAPKAQTTTTRLRLAGSRTE